MNQPYSEKNAIPHPVIRMGDCAIIAIDLARSCRRSSPVAVFDVNILWAMPLDFLQDGGRQIGRIHTDRLKDDFPELFHRFLLRKVGEDFFAQVTVSPESPLSYLLATLYTLPASSIKEACS